MTMSAYKTHPTYLLAFRVRRRTANHPPETHITVRASALRESNCLMKITCSLIEKTTTITTPRVPSPANCYRLRCLLVSSVAGIQPLSPAQDHATRLVLRVYIPLSD